MTKNKEIKSILIIGAGPIIIGQACEFDYSGTQGAKILKEEGYRVILVNSNPATIMTDQDTADKIYLEPITEEIITQILKKELPDAILPTLGGQTALNVALNLNKSGILKELNIKLIGVDVEAIEKAENRGKFKELVENIEIWSDITSKYEKLKCPKSVIVDLILDKEGGANLGDDYSLDSIKDNIKVSSAIGIKNILKHINLPLIIRPSLTLGGTGGGIAHTETEYMELMQFALCESPINQVQIDEDLTGWKEYEMEVVRDKNDNAIIVCSIENIDPMGVHTGDSITVSPAMTLTDKEYQFMRDASIEILRAVGVETGGSNVQFAVNPKNGDLVVIEMNPRVSRSSALVSKATGFPIAKVAAKLAVGYTLDEIKNDIACGIPKNFDYLEFKNVINGKAKNTEIENYIAQQKQNGVSEFRLMQSVLPASFEPSIDYVVVKIPKFNFEKFRTTEPLLGTQMQSIGEVMAIGRTFNEAMEKGFDSLEKTTRYYEKLNIKDRLKINSPSKIFDVLDALKNGMGIEEIANISKYDRWFVEQLSNTLNKIEQQQMQKQNIIDKLKLNKDKIVEIKITDAEQLFKKDKINKVKNLVNIVYTFFENKSATSPIGNISFTKNGFGSLLSPKHIGNITDIKLKILQDLKNIIEKSIYTGEYSNNHNGKNFNTYNLYTTAKINDEYYIVKTIIKEMFDNENQARYTLYALKVATKKEFLFIGFKGHNKNSKDILSDITRIKSKIPNKIADIHQTMKTAIPINYTITQKNNMSSNFNNYKIATKKEFLSEALSAKTETPISKIADIHQTMKTATPINNNITQINNKSNNFELPTKVVFKKIDTCANEFNTNVNYFYSTKEIGYKKLGSDVLLFDNEAKSINEKKVIILGSSANRIGQGIEFDYACVQASKSLKDINIKTIMVNCNPETVSTDYDVSDRLYFEPVSPVYVSNIILNELDIDIDEYVFNKKWSNLSDLYDYFIALPDLEKTETAIKELKNILQKYISVAITFGGQTALNMRKHLKDMFIPVFGNSENAIEICDDREEFEKFCKDIDLARPKSIVCNDLLTLDLSAQSLNYNFIIRPTSVIGGRGMSIIQNEEEYRQYLQREKDFLPCVVDEFLKNFKEFDVDLIKDKDGAVFIAGIMEQLEYTGVHSGDSACLLCDYDFTDKEKGKIKDIVLKIAKKLDVIGAINIQLATRYDELYIIEVNPRISRTLPFISKSTKCPLVAITTKIMAGKSIKECVSNYDVVYDEFWTFNKLKYIYLKEAVFSFAKFAKADIELGPEMHSTGEVIGIGRDMNEAVVKTLLGSGIKIQEKNIAILSTQEKDSMLLDLTNLLIKNGYKVYAVKDTYNFLKDKVKIGLVDNIAFIKNNIISLLISTIKKADGLDFLIRKEAIGKRTPHSTNIETAEILVNALETYYGGKRGEIVCE
ncbi:MAG: hypothetical protein Ta2D_08630 [Rickettsiales bacterium]|nr:MAG: hypothetical protein Ta2D_08630 [Rickettsiales bacterium]